MLNNWMYTQQISQNKYLQCHCEHANLGGKIKSKRLLSTFDKRQMCIYFANSAKKTQNPPFLTNIPRFNSPFFFQKQTSADCPTKILAKMHLWLETRGCSRAYITTDRVNQLVDTSVCQAKESTQLFPAGSLTVWRAAMHF